MKGANVAMKSVQSVLGAITSVIATTANIKQTGLDFSTNVTRGEIFFSTFLEYPASFPK